MDKGTTQKFKTGCIKLNSNIIKSYASINANKIYFLTAIKPSLISQQFCHFHFLLFRIIFLSNKHIFSLLLKRKGRKRLSIFAFFPLIFHIFVILSPLWKLLFFCLFFDVVVAHSSIKSLPVWMNFFPLTFRTLLMLLLANIFLTINLHARWSWILKEFEKF